MHSYIHCHTVNAKRQIGPNYNIHEHNLLKIQDISYASLFYSCTVKHTLTLIGNCSNVKPMSVNCFPLCCITILHVVIREGSLFLAYFRALIQ